jgi:HD-GYP domain-containing protein (c-di-GMP phosphodiesterase class II)
MSEIISEFCLLLVASASRCRLYGPEHPLTSKALQGFMDTLHRFLEETNGVRITIGPNEVFFNDKLLPSGMGPSFSLTKRLADKGIGLLEFRRGITELEVRNFCLQLENPRATELASQPHLRLGEVTLSNAPVKALQSIEPEIENLRVQNLAGDRADAVAPEVHALAELQERTVDEKSVPLTDYEKIVRSFVSDFAGRRDIFYHLAEIRDHHLFTFLHTCNVTNLAIGFALGLGVSEKNAHDLGVAAMLHDIGKAFIPLSILNKPTRLDRNEWTLVRRHPVEGAQILLREEGCPHLAVVAAFEHHMHYQIGGGYPNPDPPYRPSVPSQILAIVDAFDALFANRSYHQSYDVMEVLEILQDDSGNIYAPWLVDAFSRFITVNLDTREALDDREPPAEARAASESPEKPRKGLHIEAVSRNAE